MVNLRNDKEFDSYRNRIVSRLPMYAELVFSFRGVGYMGCGFHYDLEKKLGIVISMSQNVSRLYSADKKKRIMNRILFRVIVMELSRNIVRIMIEKGKL